MPDLLDDHVLMLKVKSGELEKLGLIYQRYSRRLFGFFYRLTTDRTTSEDLVQNVFMRILKYRKSYREDGKFETWIFQMARNVHKDHIKKNARYQVQEDMSPWEFDLADHSNEESRMVKADRLKNLASALQQLPVENRELLELSRFQRMKYADIGRLFNLSESAVKVRIHRTMKELRSHYLKLDSNK